MKRLLAGVGTLVFLLSAACSEVSFVDEVTIVNNTEYAAHVEVTDRARDGWLGLTTVRPQSTKTVERVIDQGDMWIFRFDYAGKHQEEVEVTRPDLERNDWTVEIPQSFEQGLRDLGVVPPPP